MPWQAHLNLRYCRDDARTVLQHRHDGPLRILKSLYPEGDGICHNVIVHPPGGLVGGDALDIEVHAGEGTHALLSTPGATRFYRSDGPQASQRVRLHLDPGARLEWLPLEAIAYPDCHALNRLDLRLAPGAECLGWDVCALGLPHAGQPFERGRIEQHIERPGVWLERALIDAADTRLLGSPLGLAGQRCLGSLWLWAGEPLAPARREHLLDALRQALAQAGAGVQAGATSPHPEGIVVRALAPVVEPLMALFQALWAVLRAQAWGLPVAPPRIWRV